ncbi:MULTISPECIES: LysR family transcriptional regulator [Paenibacillus]|uniref:LysR family transcriptional regulator n=1 Tax=Paenibacillus TaxID=44249 RepID=UPI0022B8FEE7|nr:LysR family transcriptional regulator [Paenibacillus caseinilyticus]MCZ8520281.1 LysR family transcriptional regulator [Paenibacillus caseinilyticus]
MNTEFLKGFMETARTKSISKASEALHISHTALSKQLRSLEQQFDVQLFARSSQGVELTDAGKVLYDSSQLLLDQLAVLTRSLEPYKGWRHIRIGTIPDIASQYLLASLHKLEEHGHEVELVCRQSTPEIYKMLLNGEVDVLVAERISMHPSIWMGDLHQEPLLVVMRTDHPFAAKPAVTLAELSSQPLVLYAEGCTIRAKLTDLFAAVNYPMHIKTEVNFKEVILGYVGNGGGLTVLPEPYLAQLPTDRLVSVPLHHPDAKRTIAVFSTNRAKGQKIFRLLS